MMSSIPCKQNKFITTKRRSYMRMSEEHVKDGCPCDKCLVFPSCRNKNFTSLIKGCSLLYAYLLKKRSGSVVVLDLNRFNAFCKLMGISVSRNGKNISVRHWE